MAEEKLNIIITAQDKTGGKLNKLSSTLGLIGGVAGAVAYKGIGLLADGIGQLAANTIELVKQAPELMNLQKTFEGFAGGADAADDLLREMNKLSNNMITNRQFMESYNLASLLVGDTLANELPEALTYLNKIQASTGEDMDYLLDSLVRGTSRLSTMILDNIGVTFKASDAYEAYGRSLGIADENLSDWVKGMTKTQQQEAFLMETMKQLQEKTAGLEVMADPFKQLDTTIANLKDTFITTIGPVVLPIISELASQLSTFVQSEEFQEWIRTTGEWLTTNLVPALMSLIGAGDETSNMFTKIAGVINLISAILSPFIKGWQLVYNLWLKFQQYCLTPIINGFKIMYDWIIKIKNALPGLSLPDWLTPGSPTPLELGLKGINSAMRDLSGTQLPAFGMQTARLAPAYAGSGRGGAQIIINYAPAVSLADRAEVETKLVPLIDNAMRRVKRGKV